MNTDVSGCDESHIRRPGTARQSGVPAQAAVDVTNRIICAWQLPVRLRCCLLAGRAWDRRNGRSVQLDETTQLRSVQQQLIREFGDRLSSEEIYEEIARAEFASTRSVRSSRCYSNTGAAAGALRRNASSTDTR